MATENAKTEREKNNVILKLKQKMRRQKPIKKTFDIAKVYTIFDIT